MKKGKIPLASEGRVKGPWTKDRWMRKRVRVSARRITAVFMNHAQGWSHLFEFFAWPSCARKREYPFFFKSNVSELEYISTRRKNSSISSLSLSLSAHPVSPCSSARNHETTTDIDTWPHAPGTTLQIRRPLLYRAIDHRRAIVRSSLSDGEDCTLGFIERGAGRVTHLYSTFGGFASARHLKRSSLPSTMRPFLPNPDRILRDTFGA